jgi:formylglycine-generating enzyme
MFRNVIVRGLLVVAMVCCVVVAQATVTIDLVPVGDPGNAADTTGYGSVAYTYNIGKYEVTAGQYAEFLKAVAKTDAYGLYNTYMSSSYGCGIQRTGSSGSYTYSVASDYANRPVNYVSWGDAARFANWLHNGQPGLITPVPQDQYSTEDGAYYLNGATTNAALLAVSRETDWKWAVTSEDEWYKAAYYKGDGLYSLYANGTSTAPIAGTDTNYNWAIGSTWDGTSNGALEQNGTKDMMGNVWEWNEAVISTNRCLRGGSFGYNEGVMASSYGNYFSPPTYEYDFFGFRVASVPEPGSLAMLAGVALTVLLCWWRKRV